MRPSVAVVAELVAGILPGEPQEASDVATALSWLDSTDDVFRRVKPAVPDRHLVSYVVPTDPGSGRVLLGEHLNATLWLPPGGHVEVDEHPAVTAEREAAEELGIDPRRRLSDRPVFLSSTVTVGVDSGHTDVALWFPIGFSATSNCTSTGRSSGPHGGGRRRRSTLRRRRRSIPPSGASSRKHRAHH
jgi:hypothetical protein